MHIAHEATRAIAALLHFPAVRVKDAIAKIRIPVCRFYQQDLVATYSEMPIG
jgi:hypothetical protein